MISLVVPMYKERANIERLVERAGAALSRCGEEYELIVVDDGSPDGTGVAIYFAVSLLLHATLGMPLGFSLMAGIGIAAVWNFLLNSQAAWQAWWDRKLLSRKEWIAERP